ncbi:MAG: hypothetical protein ICV63_16180 [Coleofasciculus sp. Co-bin14]|nr:hypothetical protein [Coleofasciculus sp. Co-bin14]
MREATELEKQQYQRLRELLSLAQQRYLDAGGDPRHPPSGQNGDDYLTDEERQEAIMLGRAISGVRIVGNEVHCQGRSWKVPINTVNNEDTATCES